MTKKNVKIKELIEREFSELTGEEISEKLKEMDKKLSEIKLNIQFPQIDPEIIQSIKNLSKVAQNSTQPLVSAISSFSHAFSLSLPQINLINTLKSIDWSGLTTGLKASIEKYEHLMQKYDMELWAIDGSLFEILELDEVEPPSYEMVERNVENLLDSYMEDFKKDQMYNKYISIIEQSYTAFKSKQYAIATFPLLAVVDGIMASTFSEYEIDVQLKPKLRKQKNKLFVKVKDYVESKEDELAVILLFFRRVYYAYQEIFKPSWDNHPEQINRNWLMHGSYDYDKITKTDVLRLFQLVKALEIVKYISFEKEADGLVVD